MIIFVFVMTDRKVVGYFQSCDSIKDAVLGRIEEKIGADKGNAISICKNYRGKFKDYLSRNSNRGVSEGFAFYRTFDAVKELDGFLYFKIGGLGLKDFQRKSAMSRRLTHKLLNWRVDI